MRMPPKVYSARWVRSPTIGLVQAVLVTGEGAGNVADDQAATVRTTPAEKRALARRLRDADTHRAYAACNTLTGPLTTPTGPHLPVVYRSTARPAQRFMLSVLISLNFLTAIVFIGWLALPRH